MQFFGPPCTTAPYRSWMKTARLIHLNYYYYYYYYYYGCICVYEILVVMHFCAFRCVCNWCWSWGTWRCQLGCYWWSSSLCGAVAGPWCWHWSYWQHQTDTTAPGVILRPWASGMFWPIVKAWKILQFSLVDSCSILLLLRVWHLFMHRKSCLWGTVAVGIMTVDSP